ncbi:hypothetical protein B0H14DRAFT_2812458 [Mycena olivaceomarginata]|nr:hypothetical protein B0H14DRAFT_2812458 [Mycena olivaceomarginata]
MAAPLHSESLAPPLHIDPFILSSPPTPTGRPLNLRGEPSQDGITLLLLHGLGQRRNSPQIREAWVLDWQSHGESAVLNEESLKDDPASARAAIANFLNSDLVAGHQLVGVGNTWNPISDEIQLPPSTWLANAVKHRRDIPWNSWDPRIVALFSEHALKSSTDKDGKACVVRNHTWDAVEQLSRLARRVPIHVVFGESVDLM